jgi:hypothetical protein
MEPFETLRENLNRLETETRAVSNRAENALRRVLPVAWRRSVDWQKVTPTNLQAALRDAGATFAGHFRPAAVSETPPSA